MDKTQFYRQTPITLGHASLFACENNSEKAVMTFTTPSSSVSVHLTPAELTEVAKLMMDASDWMMSIAAREANRREAEEREDDTRDLPSIAELDMHTPRFVNSLMEAA